MLDRLRTGEKADADARRAYVVDVLQAVRSGDFATEAVSEIARQRRCRRSVFAQILEHDDELVAPQARDRIGLAQGQAQALRHFD